LFPIAGSITRVTEPTPYRASKKSDKRATAAYMISLPLNSQGYNFLNIPDDGDRHGLERFKNLESLKIQNYIKE